MSKSCFETWSAVDCAVAGTEEVYSENKAILKAVAGYVATVRKQEGEKLIVLKNEFSGKSTDEIWSILMSTLPTEDIRILTNNNNIQQEMDENLNKFSSEEIEKLELKRKNFQKGKSVRDLTAAYNEYASESSVSLADHAVRLAAGPSKSLQDGEGGQQQGEMKSADPATRRAWLLAASRADYHTLAKASLDYAV